MKCLGKWVPAILIDNGSAINVCPLRTAYCMGLKSKDFAPSTLGVRAYDNTRRDVLGTINLELATGKFKTTVEFCVLEIPASFNLLLGRPWLHRSDVMGVPSTLHQKLILGLDSGTLIIHGDSGIRHHSEDNSPMLEIMHREEASPWGGLLS